jgi:hypothetical protein
MQVTHLNILEFRPEDDNVTHLHVLEFRTEDDNASNSPEYTRILLY